MIAVIRRAWRCRFILCLIVGLEPSVGRGQIDPVRRDLVQLGYNAALEGQAPLSGYAFYYRNQPGFLATNLTLRLAVAPVYLDSELGIRQVFGEDTDLGIDLAGGGFADNYNEIRGGRFYQSESFTGDGGQAGLSVYHLFNPGRLIPLNGLVRGLVHYTAYVRDDETAAGFQLPRDQTAFEVRTGLRWGGREPTLLPELAMELSVWYEGMFRTEPAMYGYGSDPRRVEGQSHLFWGEAFLGYTLPELKHSFYVNLTAGSSVEADRFSAYRLGGLLPLVSEFPLSLPGYYYQEITARQFGLASGTYLLPLDHHQRWNVDVTAATAVVSYLPGLEQPGDWHSGVGAGMLFKTPSCKIMAGYGYGINAIRNHGPGASSIGIWMQFDLEKATGDLFKTTQPGLWRGLQQILTR